MQMFLNDRDNSSAKSCLCEPFPKEFAPINMYIIIAIMEMGQEELSLRFFNSNYSFDKRHGNFLSCIFSNNVEENALNPNLWYAGKNLKLILNDTFKTTSAADTCLSHWNMNLNNSCLAKL